MVNHHFALLILHPRGNRACFIQQFIRSLSILALNTLTPLHHAQCLDPPSSGMACLKTSQLSFQTADRTAKHHYIQTVYRLNQHHCRFLFTELSIAAVSTSLPNITHRKKWEGDGGSVREGLGQQH